MSLARGVLLLAALLCAPAQAQLSHPLVERTPLERAREAFANAYGELLVAAFARTLRDSAAPACVAERGIQPHRWHDEARLILERRGGQMLHLLARATDAQRFDALISAYAGPGATAEILRLRRHPDVIQLLALERPIRLARLAEHITEIVDRYALLNRFALKGTVSPVASGNPALLAASPEATAEQQVEAFLAGNKSAEIVRFLELSDAVDGAQRDAQRTEEMLKLGPSQMMAGLDEDFAALCVPTK